MLPEIENSFDFKNIKSESSDKTSEEKRISSRV
jgi:hypothetical protein